MESSVPIFIELYRTADKSFNINRCLQLFCCIASSYFVFIAVQGVLYVTNTTLFCLFSSASDLVMKVDALLSSQPKGDARIEYNLFEDRYR